MCYSHASTGSVSRAGTTQYQQPTAYFTLDTRKGETFFSMDQEERSQASASGGGSGGGSGDASGGARLKRIPRSPKQRRFVELTSEWIRTPVTNQSIQKYQASGIQSL